MGRKSRIIQHVPPIIQYTGTGTVENHSACSFYYTIPGIQSVHLRTKYNHTHSTESYTYTFIRELYICIVQYYSFISLFGSELIIQIRVDNSDPS